MGLLQAIRRLAGAPERLLELRLQHGDLPGLPAAPGSGGLPSVLRDSPLLVDGGVGRDLRIVRHRVITSTRRR